MNEYYCLVTIPTANTKHWIEVGITIMLPFHPNLTDELEVMGFPCKINSIYYTPENIVHGDSITIKLTAVDCLYVGKDEAMALDYLNREFHELKRHYGKIIFNDASDYAAMKSD